MSDSDAGSAVGSAPESGFLLHFETLLRKTQKGKLETNEDTVGFLSSKYGKHKPLFLYY